MNRNDVAKDVSKSLTTYVKKVDEKLTNLISGIKEKKNIHQSLFFISLLVIFFILLLFNYLTPMNGDDYVYSFIYQTPHRITSVSDILESQYLHYFQWGGRSVVHFILQLLLLIKSPLVIDIINSGAFVALLLLVYLHITKAREYKIRLLVLIFLLIWSIQPAFAETTLWLTGSANYLWGTIIILAFLLPYRLFQNKPIGQNKNILFSILFFIGGIIAGWTNENSAAGMIAMAFLFIIYYRMRKYKIHSWMFFGIVGALVGYIVMICAPGNFVRATGTAISPFHILYRTLTSTQKFIEYLGLLNLGAAILGILLIRFSPKEKVKRIIPLVAIYIVGTLISIYIMVASPGFPPRAWFGPIIFNIVMFGVLVYNLNYSYHFLYRIYNALIIYLILAFCFTFYDALRDTYSIHKIWENRLPMIEREKQKGATSITFKAYHAKTKFGLGDAPYAKKYISDYYGIDFNAE